MFLVEEYDKLENDIYEKVEKEETNKFELLYILGRFRILLLNMVAGIYGEEEMDEILKTNVMIEKIKKNGSNNCNYDYACPFFLVRCLDSDNEAKEMCKDACLITKYFDFEGKIFERLDNEGITFEEVSETYLRLTNSVEALNDIGELSENPRIPNISDERRIKIALAEYGVLDAEEEKDIRYLKETDLA